jgi:hypothetical protein
LRGYLPAFKRLHLAGSEHRELDLVLGRARGQLSGFVLDSARLPIKGARLVVKREALKVSGHSDRSGYFTLHGVGSEPVDLEVEHSGYLPLRKRIKPSRWPVELKLAFQAAVSGRVQDHRTGAPISSFSIRVCRNKACKGGGEKPLLVRDPSGEFTLHGLAPGKTVLGVRAPRFADHRETVIVKKPSRPKEIVLDRIEINLLGAGTIYGRVTGALGRGLAGAIVHAAGVQARSNKNGHFTLERVPEGSHPVLVTVANNRSQWFDPVVVRAGDRSGPLRLEMR